MTDNSGSLPGIRRAFDAALIAAAGRTPPGSKNADSPAFSTFIDEATDAAEALMDCVKEIALTADGSGETLTAGLERYLEKAISAANFVASAPDVLQELCHALARELRLPDDPESLRAHIGYPESPESSEIKSLYRIALAIGKDPAGRDLVLDLSSNRAARGLQAEFPAISALIDHHLAEYGWVRSARTNLDPLSPKELMQRIQVALLRWDAGTLAVAAGLASPSKKTQAAKDVPEKVPGLIEACRTVAGGLSFRPVLLVKARWISRSFWEKVAKAAGCSNRQLAYATPAEIRSALNGTARLEVGELDLRATNGFSLLGSGGQVSARSNDASTALPEDLTGQSVSLGRAAGRVKVILDADEGGKLEVGDILVTNLSTPNYEGQPSVFPYRTVPAVAIEKAAAIVTDEGGLLSHAAIICRENRVPCILGSETATSVLRDGMIVEVDATRAAGTVAIIQA